MFIIYSWTNGWYYLILILTLRSGNIWDHENCFRRNLEFIRPGISSNGEKIRILENKMYFRKGMVAPELFFYWSAKLWLLIKIKIQAFRNMNHSYDHYMYMKQEKIWVAHLDLQSENGFMMNRSSRTLIFLMWNYILLSSSGKKEH